MTTPQFSEALRALRVAVNFYLTTYVPTRHHQAFSKFFNSVWPHWAEHAAEMGRIPQTAIDNFETPRLGQVRFGVHTVVDPKGKDLPYAKRTLQIPISDDRQDSYVNLTLHKYHEPLPPARRLKRPQFDRLIARYTGPIEFFDLAMTECIDTYRALTPNGDPTTLRSALRLPPALFAQPVFDYWKRKHECFGGAPVAFADSYSSPWRLEMDLFGARGPFQKYAPQSADVPEIAIAQPPHDAASIQAAVEHLVMLCTKYTNLSVLMLVPTWSALKIKPTINKIHRDGHQYATSGWATVPNGETDRMFLYNVWRDIYEPSRTPLTLVLFSRDPKAPALFSLTPVLRAWTEAILADVQPELAEPAAVAC